MFASKYSYLPKIEIVFYFWEYFYNIFTHIARVNFFLYTMYVFFTCKNVRDIKLDTPPPPDALFAHHAKSARIWFRFYFVNIY